MIEVTKRAFFNYSELDDEQVETLKLEYQKLVYKQLHLTEYSIAHRREALIAYYDVETNYEIVFYKSGWVRVFTPKAQTKDLPHYYIKHPKNTKLSVMMNSVISNILVSRSLEEREILRKSNDFLMKVAGSKEEYERLTKTDEELLNEFYDRRNVKDEDKEKYYVDKRGAVLYNYKK